MGNCYPLTCNNLDLANVRSPRICRAKPLTYVQSGNQQKALKSILLSWSGLKACPMLRVTPCFKTAFINKSEPKFSYENHSSTLHHPLIPRGNHLLQWDNTMFYPHESPVLLQENPGSLRGRLLIQCEVTNTGLFFLFRFLSPVD